MIQTVETSAGPIDYLDSGGAGPTVVMTPGLVMDETLWAGVVDRLAPDHRCVVPRLPLGGHRHPMHADADLSLHALADLLGELLADEHPARIEGAGVEADGRATIRHDGPADLLAQRLRCPAPERHDREAVVAEPGVELANHPGLLDHEIDVRVS